MSEGEVSNTVTITVDGIEVKVAKGTNLIEAAKLAGVDIPYYCYHPDLSIAGNCRMCQVEVEGMPKLTIGCNTGATEGMVVKTQKSSEKVADAQRATLEFLLINHPLDCTVCDQAGHCKLQDYYYDYNAQPSRFVEEKVQKVKAEPLGPGVIYDGERCILCTRCVRFCDEVSETGELGLYNRGDKAVIGIHPSAPLDNPLSGNVVDLCPVGALTHRKWRFNSRIWYTKETKSICVGCSTGCNVQVCTRDEEFVQIKGRYNAGVNKEWLCDEGRYGFERFQPDAHLATPYIRSTDNYLEPKSLDQARNAASPVFRDKGSSAAVFLSPFLTLEEMWLGVRFAREVMGLKVGQGDVAVQCQTRKLSKVEQVLVSPDYAPNARAATLLGIVPESPSWRELLQADYEDLLERVRNRSVSRVMLIGDRAIHPDNLDEGLIGGLLNSEVSISIGSAGVLQGESKEDGVLGAQQLCKVLLPAPSVYEQSGLMVNKDLVLQRVRQVMPNAGEYPSIAQHLYELSKRSGRPLLLEEPSSYRTLFKELSQSLSILQGLSLSAIGDEGVSLSENFTGQGTDRIEGRV